MSINENIMLVITGLYTNNTKKTFLFSKHLNYDYFYFVLSN